MVAVKSLPVMLKGLACVSEVPRRLEAAVSPLVPRALSFLMFPECVLKP